ncbi:MAG TPA: cytochrome c [Oxalicibacterium sp.]|uniref:c-type cytochrome n=1 Tax=Oxalicibacterium sp. TaxID=2766525 RepID=UPI002B967647|nr:cytochrome c [Oxalicibacterium sp.]HWU99066.1 cytochrome c [Oxalicibacterium sp.]
MKKIIASTVVLLSATISFNALAESQIEAGKAAVAKFNCASCHGADYNTPIDPAYPKLAGQHKDYLEHALVAYRRGAGASNSRSNPIMGPLAKQLSDQDIKNIAAYLHSLPGTLVLRK